MRTQAPSHYQTFALSNLDILLKVLLPAFFARPSAADYTQYLLSRGPINSDCPLRQFKCKNGRCVQLAWICDGADDCGDNSDETASQCKNRFACTNDQFTCRNGVCIPLSYHCDRERDCPDGSDEGDDVCGTKKCEKDHFECGPGHCIPSAWVCDGKHDCKDSRDELNCNKTCAPNEFTCANSQCIQSSWVCDSEPDCDDGSDERNCTARTCPDSDFQCADKSCITKKWRCDGATDCPDGSDEVNCPKTNAERSICSPKEFACPDGIHCIKSFLLCDGEPDCQDGGDESPDVCSNLTCSDSQFQCRNYHCIDGTKRCDGQKDCSDGSDEDNCEFSCHKDEFNCGEGICIPMNKVCDRIRDCPYGDDEPRGKCNVNECRVRNGGCSDICVDTLIGHHCKCHPGYKLVNNTACADINECENPGSCSQICHNEKGSFSCDCMEGYIKDPVYSTRCIANSSHSISLIFTRRNDIRMISSDGQNMTIIANDTRSSYALDFCYERSEIFWSDVLDHTIYKSPINATHLRTVVVNGTGTSEGLAVDWIYHNIYWTDTKKKTIEMSNYKGTIRKTLFSKNLREPRAIAVNPLEGWMFWTDWGNDGCIERAGLDGSHRRKIVSYEVKWPNGLTLDLVRRRLYWVDAKTNMVSSVNFDGTGRAFILRSDTALHHPFSITVFEDSIYWTDWDRQTIFKANKFNGSDVEMIIDERMLQNPMAVHVYHPYRQSGGANHCKKLNCSHLCVPLPNLNSFSPKVACTCPDGLSLNTDGLTCLDKTSPLIPEISYEDTTPAAEDPVVIDRNKIGNVGFSFYLVFGLATVLLAIPVFTYVAYRLYRSKTVNRMTFYCPEYVKPADDDIIKKPYNSNIICQFDSEAQEPLKKPVTNGYL